MREQTIHRHQYANGLTLVVEPMRDVQSVAFSFLVPCGSVYDPNGKNGTASILRDLIMRGAGERDSRQLLSALENLGVQHSEGVSCNHITFTGAMLSENLADSLRIYADVLLRPHLPENEFEPAKLGIEQSLRAIEDEPKQKVMIELRRRCFNTPWGLPSEGDLNDLPAIDVSTVRDQFTRCFRPNGTILGVAGRVDFEEVKDLVDEVLGSWEDKPEATFETGARGPSVDQIEHDSTQTQIGIAYEAVPYRHPDYYAAWASVSVLSGGMSARLFTEVRERRGLCYAVFASLNSLPHEGRVLCYAGTTAERAQETLDVTLRELVRLGDGIEPGELDRCKARAKTSIIMQQESTISRSSSIARDWFHLGRVQTLSEIREKIDGLTVPAVLDYIRQYPARDFSILTIGPQPLEVSVEVPSNDLG